MNTLNFVNFKIINHQVVEILDLKTQSIIKTHQSQDQNILQNVWVFNLDNKQLYYETINIENQGWKKIH